MKLLSLFFISTCHSLHAIYGYDFSKDIVDITHPTIAEYQKIQEYLSTVSDIDLPPSAEHRCKIVLSSMKLVGLQPNEIPYFDILYLNENPNDKKNCIVQYVTFNPPYPDFLFRRINALKRMGFNGHILTRIGGFPNIENGSLKLLDVPYAFKACAIMEAHNLGYQNILWLDSSLLPIRRLDGIFELIEQNGYFAFGSGSTLQAEADKGFTNSIALSACGVSYEEAAFIPHIAGPAYGINMQSPIGQHILHELYSLAETKREAFLSDWVDEVPLSAILYQMGKQPMSTWHRYFIKLGEWEGLAYEPFFIMNLKRPRERYK